MQKFNNIEEIKGYINTLDIAPNEQDLLDIIYTIFVKFKTPFSKVNKYTCFYNRSINGIGCAIGAVMPDKLLDREDKKEIETISIDCILNDDKFEDIQNYFICHKSHWLLRLQQIHDLSTNDLPEDFENRFLYACKHYFEVSISDDLLTEASKKMLDDMS